MTPNNQPPAADKVQEVIVNVILDRSGSMETCRAGTIDGYNEYLNGLKAEKETKYSITLTQFDSPANIPELTVSYEDKPLAEASRISRDSYQPRGGTPLYDAVGECVRRVNVKGRGVIVVIITDGQENSSHEFTKDSIKALIKSKESEGWTFTFLGANIDSYAVGGGIGVPLHNVANYSVGDEKNLYATLAHATNMRASSMRSHGVMAASASAFVSQGMRASLEKPKTTGGRPPVLGKFQPKVNKQSPRITQWKVSGQTGKQPTPDYVTPDEAASALGVTRRSVYNWVRSGELPAKKIGSVWRINRQDL